MALTIDGNYIDPQHATYGQARGVGVNKENLIELLGMISPYDRPLHTMLPKPKTGNNIEITWFEKELSTVSVAGTQDGEDFGANELTQPTVHKNWVQNFSKHIGVADIQRELRPAAIGDPLVRETVDALREMGRNTESKIFGPAGVSNATEDDDTVTTPRLMKTLQDFIQTNAYNCGVVAGTMSGGVAGDVLTEARFVGLSRKIWDSGGDNANQVFCNGLVAEQINDFANVDVNSGRKNERVIDAADRRYETVINVIGTSYGDKFVHLDRWVADAEAGAAASGSGDKAADGEGSLFMLDVGRLQIPHIFFPRVVDIAKLGLSDRRMVAQTCTLVCQNEAAHGRLFDILTGV